jgi:hypothetical protein
MVHYTLPDVSVHWLPKEQPDLGQFRFLLLRLAAPRRSSFSLGMRNLQRRVGLECIGDSNTQK